MDANAWFLLFILVLLSGISREWAFEREYGRKKWQRSGGVGASGGESGGYHAYGDGSGGGDGGGGGGDGGG